MSGARYVVVDVLDLAALVHVYENRAMDAGRPLEGKHAALVARVNQAPMATVPCTIKLNEDGGVWITPDPAPDPRGGMPTTSVPSNAPPPPLPLLEDFDTDGHLRTCPPHHRPCQCPAKLLRVARAWAQAYKARPAAMVFTPAEPDVVRTYGVYKATHISHVVGFLNDHRECKPVAVIVEGGALVVLYVEEVRRG